MAEHQMGFRQHGAHDAAKGAISAMTRTLAVEYGPTVRVKAVLPGGIRTAAWAHTTPAYQFSFLIVLSFRRGFTSAAPPLYTAPWPGESGLGRWLRHHV
jgi:NAD(P)-dependent dehydrogenase (short-subunit alcohol dehydrogenase family)